MRLVAAAALLLLAVRCAALTGPVSFQPFGRGGTVMEIAYLEDSNFVYIAGINSSSAAAVTMFDATHFGPLASFDAGFAHALYLFPFTDANTLVLVAVRSNGTDFYVLNSVLEEMCSNSTDMLLKSNSMGSAGLGLVVGGQLWFLDPSTVGASRNRFWNLDMISCNLSASALPLANANFSYTAGAQSMMNLGVVLSAGLMNGKPSLATLEFAASNVSIPVAPSLALASTPVAVTPASPNVLLPLLMVALSPNTLQKYAGGTAWGAPQGSAQVGLPSGHAIARVTYNANYTILGTRASSGGGLALVNSALLTLTSFTPLAAPAFSAWMSLAASSTSVCAQGVADTVMCWQI